jgi:hypothetical protein
VRRKSQPGGPGECKGRLADGSYRHDVTIVALDPANDLMEVRYVKTGRVEPKRLSAVAQYWYVKE